VTATDTATGKTGSTAFRITAVAPLNTVAAPSGQMPLSAGDLCLSDPGTPGGQASVVTCDPAAHGQLFSLHPGAVPGAADTLVATGSGRCLGESAATDQSPAAFHACDGSAAQQWLPLAGGQVANAASGMCLGTQAARTVPGTAVEAQNCSAEPGQYWALPAAPITSGDGGCLTADAPGGPVTVTACTGAKDQQWTSRSDGLLTVTTNSGVYCLGTGQVADSGQALTLETCAGAINAEFGQLWFTRPDGQFGNYFTKCMYYPGGTVAVVQQDCYGLYGQIWSTI
jgi:hypothetical protein